MSTRNEGTPTRQTPFWRLLDLEAEPFERPGRELRRDLDAEELGEAAVAEDDGLGLARLGIDVREALVARPPKAASSEAAMRAASGAKPTSAPRS